MSEETKSVLEEAKDRFATADKAWKNNLDAALEDMRFRKGEQWPADIKSDREKKGRPCLTVDKVSQYVHQVVNDGRQNRPMPRVRPVDDGADPEVAKVFQGIIRHICDRSHADDAFDTALDHAATGGFGYFRVATEYAHANTFNQEIVIKRVRNLATVRLDPAAVEADGSDAKYGFVIDEIAKDDFKKQYPDAKCTDWVSDAEKYGEGWIADSTVRVVEYFYATEEPRTLHLLEDNTVVSDDDYQAAVKAGIDAPAISQSRDIPVSKIKWCRLSGAEILEEKEWLGKWIPLFPVYGEEFDIEGEVTYRGLVRPAKDPQRLYNYSRSAFVERVALTPKAPFIAPDEAIEDYEDDYQRANTDNIAVLKYKAYDENQKPLPPPQRQSAADMPAGFAQDMQLSEHDIQGAVGMYNPSLGERSTEKSGKALMAQQRKGDTATFHFPDNLGRAIRHLARVLVDLIPKIYDTPRAQRILGEDGEPDFVQLNPNQKEAVVKMGAKSIFNLGVGEYDVSVSSGPSYMTKRMESADAMIALTQANPTMWNSHGDLIVKAQDWPGAEEFAERSKLLLPPQIQQAEQKNGEMPPEAQKIMAMAQQEIQKREQALQQAAGQMQQMAAKLQELQQQAQNNQDANALKAEEIRVKSFDAETKRLQVLSETQAVTPEQVQQIVLQTLQQLMTPGQIDGPPGPEVQPQATPQPAEAGFLMPEG